LTQALFIGICLLLLGLAAGAAYQTAGCEPRSYADDSRPVTSFLYARQQDDHSRALRVIH